MPFQYPESRLLIFTKAPQPGRVKRRLIPALGAEGAALLQQRLIRRLVAMMAQGGVCPLELWVAQDTNHPLFTELKRRHGLPIHLQRGRDLGERMANAFQESLGRAKQVVLIGSDCPALTPAVIGHTLKELEKADAVMGLAEDGGYVLLALKSREPTLFENIPWGTAQVAELTRQRLRALEWHWRELPELWDLDRPEDLPRLEDLGEVDLLGAPTSGGLGGHLKTERD